VRIRNIAEIYIDLFDFRKRKLSSFVKKSKQITKRNLKLPDFKIDLFNANFSTIFLSLHSHRITHASDMTVGSILFGKSAKSSSELIGKSFTDLLPDFLVYNFSKYIESLLDEGNMDVIKIGEYFTYLKDSKNKKFIFPVYLRSKVDVIDSGGELGLSMMIGPCSYGRLSLIAD